MAFETLDFQRELRRIGVDLETNIALARAMTPDAMLRWLRWLPTGLGHAEFMRRVGLPGEEGGPERALVEPDLQPADPGHRDPEVDVRRALYREMERVVWPALRAQSPEPEMLGVNFPHGEAAALANLRLLPDGASCDAVMAALNTPAPAE